MRPVTTSAFVAGNLRFIYKKCSQLEELALKDELNDVLFSHSMHPNSGVAKDLLFAVVADQPDDFVCPICLYPPVAPRITHCGHIFCEDCIRMHMLLNPNAECPVCYERLLSPSMIRVDLRLHPKTDRCRFLKVSRYRGNCVCFSEGELDFDVLPRASSESNVFCRFAMADHVYAKKLLDLEKKQLKEEIEIYEGYNEAGPKIDMLQTVLASIESEEIPEDDGPDFCLVTETLERDWGCFYQDEFGRLLFLDPLSIRILQAHFKTMGRAPHVIEFRELKYYQFTVNQKFRQRFPLLGHLPAGADVHMVLADLSEIVSKEVWNRFSKDVEDALRDDTDKLPEEEDTIEFNDFPTLGSPVTREKKHTAWDALSEKPSSTDEADFPRLGESVPRSKTANPWSKLKS